MNTLANRTGRATLLLITILTLAGCGGSGGEKTTPIAPRPISRTRQIHLYAAQTFQPLVEQLEILYEREHLDTDLVVNFGTARPPLDADQVLQETINSGALVDVMLARDAQQVDEVLHEPTSMSVWLGNRLVLIRPTGSGLRLIDLSSGDCEVCIALDRTALGRATRRSLRDRGVWTDLSNRIGLFNDPHAITTRIASAALDPALGVVFETDARISEDPVRIAATLDPGGHAIEHVAASWTTAGEAFAAWLHTPPALSAAARFAYVVPVIEPAEPDPTAPNNR